MLWSIPNQPTGVNRASQRRQHPAEHPRPIGDGFASTIKPHAHWSEREALQHTLPMPAGCFAGVFAEDLAEIGRRGKAGGGGDVFEFAVRRSQQLGGGLHAAPL
jgi:hypothetical protein